MIAGTVVHESLLFVHVVFAHTSPNCASSALLCALVSSKPPDVTYRKLGCESSAAATLVSFCNKIMQILPQHYLMLFTERRAAPHIFLFCRFNQDPVREGCHLQSFSP